MPRIEIDGQEIEVAAGTTLMEAAQQLGIYIPFFCYHPKLSVAANCRMCLVDVEKQAKPLPACATPASDGMKVSTRSKRAKMAQQGVLEFLLINHPLDCPICDQGGECPLQDITMGYANPHSLYTEEKRVVEDKDIGPLIATEMTRCIQCTRCVRFGTEIGGISELGATGRGEKMAIGTYVAKAVRSELSGNMIDLCPVGALTSKPFRYKARSWELKHSQSLCPHCSTGCNTDVQSLGKEVLRVKPRVNEAVNEEWLCDKGRFAYAGLQAEDRVLTPLLRINGVLQPVSWADALEAAANALQQVLGRSGPDAVAGIVSPSASNEELYLFQALLRRLGVRAIDHRLRQTDFRADSAMPLYPALNMSLEQLETERNMVLCHAYPREQQPLTNHRLRKAALAGARIWAMDSAQREFNFPLRQVCAPAGGDLEMYRELLANLRDGAPAQHPELQSLADALRSAEGPLFLLGNGLLQHPQAAELLAVLAAIIEQVNGRISWLAEAANSAGAWLLGCLPGRKPGGAQLVDAPRIWDEKKAFLLWGVEPEADAMDAPRVRAALSAADTVISVSSFLGAAEEYADVVLPLASWAESSGSLFNNEGRLQHYRAAVRPAGESRPGWKILRVLADHLELAGLDFDDLETVRAAWQEELGDFPLDVPGFGVMPEIAARHQERAEGLQLLGDWRIYQQDPLARRAAPLQQEPVCRLHPDTVAGMGITGAAVELLGSNGALVQLPFVSDIGIPHGAVWLDLGHPETQALGGVGTVLRVQMPSIRARA
ncbi:NADH-quinone oxidoreductase subunit NuoG [Acidithiobacillus sp. AMEEHan]|uniref:NADH-quinone oxidoreductase subunit NuoG n=1 Tax=Acidithiobacillus sp. AMEEHan TaxID=2994951 RepID=UPI0027E590E1|nr:NADH-quinone oxidoreductase subunit NuoG [Acidithiobacillus sp. AMEEHan]